LTQRVQELARELASAKLGNGLFPDVEHQCREFSFDQDRLAGFVVKIDAIRDRYAVTSELGSMKP
jgi:hypothetical protein